MTKRTMVLAFLLSVLALGPAWAEPSIEVDASETAIVFTPETAGATEAVFFVWSRKHQEFVTTELRDVRVVSAEGGSFRYESETAIPLQTVAVAVDLTNGEAAVLELVADEEPAEVEAPRRPRPGRPGIAPGRVDRVLAPGAGVLQVLFVRPGEGAWTTSAADGGFGDADVVENEVSTIALERLLGEEQKAPPAGHGKPERLLPGDVVALIDPSSLTATVGGFGPADFPGQGQ